MPDSLPPPSPWGIPSYDDRDLDALLSGEATEIPVALRPLADALAALNGPPAPAELRGEAVIMAEFRALAEFGAQPGRRSETLELPALRPGSRPRRTARHRMRRPASRRFGPFLAIAAAAAAIVGAVAFTGNLPGPIHLSAATPRAASSAAVRPTSPNLQVTSASSVPAAPPRSVQPSPSPSSSASASQHASMLCRTFLSYFKDQVAGQHWWNWPDYRQLSTEAGGTDRIFVFCQPYLKDAFPDGVPTQFPGSSGPDQPGQQGSGNGNQGGASGPGQKASYPALGGASSH
jgi:hypothetical protein